MNDMTRPRLRGLVAVRAEAPSDPKAMFAELQKGFEAFKAEHTEQLAEIKTGFADVVRAEKVDRINADVSKMQKALDDAIAKVAALQVGGGGAAVSPDAAAHSKAFGQFFRKGVEGNLHELEVKAGLTTQSDPDGGYVVPEQMETAIDRVLGTVSAVRGLARVIDISGSTYKKLVTTSGAASGWVDEGEARPETATPTLSALEFPTKELYATPGATQRTLDDAVVDIEAWLAEEVSIEFAEQEGSAFINGDGVSQPRGILGYDTVTNASWSWGKVGFVVTGAAADFAASDPLDAVIALTHSLKQGYRNNASFLMADAVQESVRKFKDGQGNYLWQPPAQLGQPATLLGKAVATDDNMPGVGANAFPIAFADWQRAYLIVDRMGIRILRDPYTNKPNVMFYVTKRVGGGIGHFEAIKLLKCST